MKSLLTCTYAVLAGLSILTTGIALAKNKADITVAVIPKVAVPFFDDCNTGATEAAKAMASDGYSVFADGCHRCHAERKGKVANRYIGEFGSKRIGQVDNMVELNDLLLMLAAGDHRSHNEQKENESAGLRSEYHF